MAMNILMVEDDEIIRIVMQDRLESFGYVVEAAEDGLAGWEKMDQTPSRFDLILLDKQMPRMNGIDLLKRIKSDSRFSELPVIMVTGDNQQDDITEGLDAGANYYLTKPCSEEVLKRVIKNVLEELQRKRELRALIGQQVSNLNLLQQAEFRFKTLSEARDLALLLASISGNPARTVGGYAELLINAVEHGNLGISYQDKSALLREDRWNEEIESRLQQPRYSDHFVSVTLQKSDTSFIVTITDQGNGFDWKSYVAFSPERAFDLHGRGIAMSKASSFDSLEYLGNGNRVATLVYLQKPKHK